jgi:xanthine dehydrogenase accessory factor
MVIVIKGAGDIASGIAFRLFYAGFSLVMTEIPVPTAVRRTVCFSEAVREGSAQVEGVTSVLVHTLDGMGGMDGMNECIARREIALFVDEKAEIIRLANPRVVVDAIMAKRNTGTKITDAQTVIGVGPGFTAGLDCHAVVETKRGHTLGRVIYEGKALPNTGIPGDIGGHTTERLIRASADGLFIALRHIGDFVHKGETVAEIAPGIPGTEKGAAPLPIPIYAAIDGILRGILPSGFPVTRGMKAGDIDPRCEKSHCFTVSDKALAVGGGVLEAILHFNTSIGERGTVKK